MAAVHNSALQVCNSLREVHSALRKLAKVAALDMYMRIVREQQIPNVNIVINVAQAVPDQLTYGDMIVQHHLPTPIKVANETEAPRQMAAFMYFMLYNMIMHKHISHCYIVCSPILIFQKDCFWQKAARWFPDSEGKEVEGAAQG